MTTATTVAITGLGLWMPGYPCVAAWSEGVIDSELPKPKGLAFDRINRRRAGRLGRAIADSASEAIAEAGADPSIIPTVVGSSIGEATTMIGLLEQMWREKTPMSPAAFTVSVHNAASGLLSISSKNRGYTTSMAADENTPAVSLLEGIGLVLQRQEPVLVVCADEAAPVCLVEDAQQWDLLAGAAVLAPADSAPSYRARLDVVCGGEASLQPAVLDVPMTHNPQVGFIDLIDAVLRAVPGSVALDRGTGRGYLAQLEFPRAGRGSRS